MQRRDFLLKTMAASAALPLASSGLFARPVGQFFMPRPSAAGDRVLVLINLYGGNDGLNTIVPFNDPVYFNSRPNLKLAPASLLPITSDLAMHSAMTDMKQMYQDGNLAVLENVGYPNQDRSHFRSTDIWNSASDAATVLYTGWLGRFLTSVNPDFPNTLPDAPFAIQISSATNLLLQSDKGNVGIAIDNPDRFFNLANGLKVDPEPLPNTLAGPELAYVRDIIAQSNKFSTSVNNAMNSGANNSVYGTDSLAQQLKVVARLINGGLTTGIYIVSIGSFDTHFSQLNPHAQLLGWLSRAMKNFMDDMTAAGNGNRVAMMTYSEFGRRLNENGSMGSDHGAASVQFVAGKPVKGGKVLGGVPSLTDLDNRGDVKFQLDYRQIYSAILEDWMGFGKANTATVLGGSFSKLDLFPGSGIRDERAAETAGYLLRQNTPNPAATATTIDFAIPQPGYVRLRIVTAEGRLAMPVVERTLNSGPHRVTVNTAALPAGTYTYLLESNGYTVSRRMAVVR